MEKTKIITKLNKNKRYIWSGKRVKNNDLQCKPNFKTKSTIAVYSEGRMKLKKDYFILELKLSDKDLRTNISPRRLISE